MARHLFDCVVMRRGTFVSLTDLRAFLISEARELTRMERESKDEIQRLRHRIQADYALDLEKRLSEMR